jgi:hypothetical protein
MSLKNIRKIRLVASSVYVSVNEIHFDACLHTINLFVQYRVT